MLSSNRELERIRRILNQHIRWLEQGLGGGADPATAIARLGRLRRQRASIDAVLRNRRIEAAKPVVDFDRWVDGREAAAEAGGWSVECAVSADAPVHPSRRET